MLQHLEGKGVPRPPNTLNLLFYWKEDLSMIYHPDYNHIEKKMTGVFWKNSIS